jgi:hypothetical protein
MKSIILLLIFCIVFTLGSNAQTEVKPPAVDKSPMDMSYFPDQYPLLKYQGKITTPPNARVIYGRPQKEGRIIFGDLIKYGEVWRVGANENTELEFYKNVIIGGKQIVKGRYSLFCIPNENEWIFILNKDTDNWGAFKYDTKKDVARIKVPTKANDKEVEALSIYFIKTNSGANLTVSWDKTIAALPIIF